MPFEPIQIALNIVGGLLILLAGVWLRMIQSRIEQTDAKIQECKDNFATKMELIRTEDTLRDVVAEFRSEMRDSFSKVLDKLDKKVDKRK